MSSHIGLTPDHVPCRAAPYIVGTSRDDAPSSLRRLVSGRTKKRVQAGLRDVILKHNVVPSSAS